MTQNNNSPVGKHYDLDLDDSLGGDNPSDYTVSSQRAVKRYVDNQKDIVFKFWGESST